MGYNYSNDDPNGLITYLQDAVDYWGSPRGQYEIKRTMYDLPLIGPLLAHDEKMKEMDATLALYGLDYDDIHYIYKTNAGSYGSTLNFISSNVKKLYS